MTSFLEETAGPHLFPRHIVSFSCVESIKAYPLNWCGRHIKEIENCDVAAGYNINNKRSTRTPVVIPERVSYGGEGAIVIAHFTSFVWAEDFA